MQDFETFNEVTEEPRQIAGLYFYQLLDRLVDPAYKVSVDFLKRPHRHQDLGAPSISQSLAQLNAKYGSEINFLAGGQRNEIYLPIFGSWDGCSLSESESSPNLRDDLIQPQQPLPSAWNLTSHDRSFVPNTSTRKVTSQ
jgi:hypothetical protein